MIGFLAEGTPDSEPGALTAFHQGLRETGYVERQNVQFDYRWTGQQRDLLLALTADLVRRDVTVIYSARGSAVAQAAKAATTTIPIVFTNGGDPVKLGLVASLNRPGGNVTGTTFFSQVRAFKAEGLSLGTLGKDRLTELDAWAHSMAQRFAPKVDEKTEVLDELAERWRAAAEAERAENAIDVTPAAKSHTGAETASTPSEDDGIDGELA